MKSLFNNLSNQKKAYLLALLAVLFWSTMSTAFKITLQFIKFDQMLFWTSFFGMIALLIINQTGKERVRFGQLTRKDIFSSALMGLFNPFLYYIVLFKAYDLLEAQIAGTLNYAWPIVLVLLSIPLLGQKIRPLSIVAIFISFFGLIIITMQGNISGLKIANPLGVSLAVGSALLWALYWILNMKDKREETGKILLNLFFGFSYILLYLLFFKGGISFPETKALIGVFYIGLFEMSITFVIWLKALKYSVNTAKVSNLIYLSPFIALFWIRIFIGEKIHVTTIIGLSFIVAGIILQQLTTSRDPAK
jgi:drug/metabolite transporter (DMT)-like permease